jgi:hypothetical protein
MSATLTSLRARLRYNFLFSSLTNPITGEF